METEHYVEERNLSIAWARALTLVSAPGRKEVAPLIVSITGFDDHGMPEEGPAIRTELDALLSAEDMQSVDTVANTIFPYRMWNPGANRAELFKRYSLILPRLKDASPKNKYGIYFERMIIGGPDDHRNQLDFVIDAYLSRNGVRRSMFQIGIFHPAQDLTLSALRGFPCLQHVTFAPVGGTLSVNAFYAMHYIVERAYGNYLGICRLGQFVAHEMRLKLARVTCYAGIAQCDIDKAKLKRMLSVIEQIKAEAEET
jgi:hypothetical protein